MKLNELSYQEGARKKSKRQGRGVGSGIGKNGGSGVKGQKSRSGGGVRLGFEGGQNPIFRRLPKRGFNSHVKNDYAIVNVVLLNKFEDGTEVTPTLLIENGFVGSNCQGVKILGDGKLEKKLTVSANKFSKSAVKAIEDAGGKTEVI